MPDGTLLRNRDLNYVKRDRGEGETPQMSGQNSTGGLDGSPAPIHAAQVTINEDGSVVIAAPAVHTRKPPSADSFHENLAEYEELDLSGIAHEVLEGVEADQKSRSEWLENYAEGMKLLGLQIEKDATGGSISKIGHPLLLQAVVEAQSAVASELMPSRGPCKVEEREGDSAAEDDLAQSLGRDLNHYLTKVAKEYYPDFDRGLFGLQFGGNLFKRVYEHPLRRRPVADSISVEDLIVSEDATDLNTATRITQRSELSTAMVKRMQWRGGWLDVPLLQPAPAPDAAQKARDEIMGTSPFTIRGKDMPHEFLQVTTDLCLEDFGYTEPDAPSDVPITYMVTLDKTSRQVVDVRRKWKRGDDMFERHCEYVQYGMIPALGFLCLGFVHLLGNQTRALRAGWRILFDAGMYGNAQGWIKARGVRATGDIRPMPGEVAEIDIGPFDDIAKAIMPLPTKDPSQVFIALCEMIGKESHGLSGAAKLPTGEGRTDVPVGTILAMLEQSTQITSAVQKRYYRTQTQELSLFKDLFAENPEALNKLNPNRARQWRTREEIMDQELVPQADPNVPSQLHRIMLATAMVTMASQNPDIYDRVAVHKRAWQSIGINDAESFLHESTAPPGGGDGKAQPDPLIGQARMIEAQAKIAKAKQDAVTDQRKAATETVEAQQQDAQMAQERQFKTAELQHEQQIEGARLAVERERLAVEQSRADAQHALALRQAAHDQEMEQRQHSLDVAGHGLERQQQQHQQGLDVAGHQLEVGRAVGEQQQAQQEHGLAQQEHGLAQRAQEQQGQQAEREHGRAREELAIKRKVASKPTPRPAGRKP